MFTDDEYAAFLAESEDDIAHYGIPGMKWGVRKRAYVPKGRQKSSKSTAAKKLSRRQVKQYIKNYNAIHGTHYKYNRHTVIKKGNYYYNAKGKRISAPGKVMDPSSAVQERFGALNAKAIKAEKPKNKAAAQRAAQIKAMKDMSLADLQAANTRLQAEQNYMRLVGLDQPLPKTKGEKFKEWALNTTKDAVTNAAKQAATNYMNAKVNELVNGKKNKQINDDLSALMAKEGGIDNVRKWNTEYAVKEQYKKNRGYKK